MSKSSREELDKFLMQNVKKNVDVNLPPEAVADLKYFAEKAKAGMPIRPDALRQWIADKHSIDMGGNTLHNAATRAGVTPWWAKK